MMKLLLLIFSLYLLALSDATEGPAKLLNLHDPTHLTLQYLSHTNLPIAVSVSDEDLPKLSSSVLTAETWLRTRVLAHFPATTITTIAVGTNVLCSRNHEKQWSLVLPTVKNIYYSLVRWSLEREIKVSAAFSTNCLQHHSEDLVKNLLNFLQTSNSTYSINPPPDYSPLSDKTMDLVSTHKTYMQKLGFFKINDINVLISGQKEKPMSRKLFLMNSKFVDPYPARPTPLPTVHSSIGSSGPANVAKKPIPPSSQITPPPENSFSFVPESPPVVIPANPPDIFATPPFIAAPPCSVAVPAPETGEKIRLWCVAKPTVPADTLQEAMDYACGEGGADCEEIMANGNCYSPDTVVAHASYAFNNYWQKNKKSGGSCSFGGTAMIINADPSFLHCKFILS